MYYSGEIHKIKITLGNIKDFRYVDDRTEQDDYINDRKALEKKMIDFKNGVKDDLTEKYPERYDLTVLTYNQYQEPFLIIDGCHRIEAMKRILPDIGSFTFWLIPTNILGPDNIEDCYKLNELVRAELAKAGLPAWVNKFEFVKIDGKLTAWKNINILDTGDTNQLLQFGVDWKFNEGVNFAINKDLKDLPKWKELIN